MHHPLAIGLKVWKAMLVTDEIKFFVNHNILSRDFEMSGLVYTPLYVFLVALRTIQTKVNTWIK